MFPIALNLAKIPVLLIGTGEAFAKRHKQLLEFGATQLSLCQTTDEWHLDLENMSSRWHDRTIIMVAGLSREISEKIATKARASGKLVNVEDVNDLCDFYFTANIKRGDLLIAVSTSGASPTLARKIRDYIGGKFGTEWEGHLSEIASFRKKIKAVGKTIPEVLEESEKFLANKGWLK